MKDDFKNIDKQLDKTLQGYEAEITAAYKQALRELKQELSRVYLKYGDKVQLKDLKIKNITNRIREIATMAGKSTKTQTEKAIKEILKESYYKSGEAITRAINTTASGADLSIEFNSLSPDFVKAAVLNTPDKIKWPQRLEKHLGNLVTTVKQEITQGVIQGKGYVKIAQGIQDRCEVTAFKALRIARTETHRVTSIGRQMAFKGTQEAAETLGLEVRKVWISVKDSRTRDTHAAMDGKLADKEGFYILPSGVKTQGPGLSGIAEEDIQCRCTEGVSIEGL